MRYALAVILLSLPAAAEERHVFHGTWGTQAQCVGEPIKPGGSVKAAPYVIGPEWLRHGQTWCRLDWFPIEPREGGLFSGAHAHCGEDAVRSYLLGMNLARGELTLRWNLFTSAGPLSRCPAR